MSQLSRRDFLSTGTAAIAAVATTSNAVPAAAATAPGQTVYSRFRRILVVPKSDIAIQTAGAELARAAGAQVEDWDRTQRIKKGDIVLALDRDANVFPDARSRLASVAGKQEWELVIPVGQALVIAGSTPRNVCKAALAWIANPEGEANRLSTYIFTERFTMWDNEMNQMHRFAKGFDRRAHMREIARLGHTGVEINRYADSGGYFVNHRKYIHDSYAWYLSYAPSLDAYVESSLTRGTYLPEELRRNLADLREAAAMAREYGMKPGFVCYEPRCVADHFFDKHPELRGSRTDHPARGLDARYQLDIAHPRVLEHYAEMMTNLMREVPDLRYFMFLVDDSGQGIPFTMNLYPGPNGSFLARTSTVEKMVADFSGTILEAGRKINPEFEVIMEMNKQYTYDECKRIMPKLPEGVTVYHPVGGSLLKIPATSDIDFYFEQDKAANVRPYLSAVVFAGWDTEPIFGVPAPGLLIEKFKTIQAMTPKRFLTNGGVLSVPPCPYNINQELYAELIRGGPSSPEKFVMETATRWCDGDRDSAQSLVEAWKTGDDSARAWPSINWYTGGGGQTQGRWVTRPLVPDITRLTEQERSAWERELFPLPTDITRLNIVFEGNVRFFTDQQLADWVQVFDEKMFPLLERTVGTLNRALKTRTLPVLEDQRDRYRGFLLRSHTDRNLYAAQLAINNWLLKNGDRAEQRSRLDTAIQAEIGNTQNWIEALKTSRTNWFHLAAREETPFMYKTPVEDLTIKLEAMQAHRKDDPGPYLEQLKEPMPVRMFSGKNSPFH